MEKCSLCSSHSTGGVDILFQHAQCISYGINVSAYKSTESTLPHQRLSKDGVPFLI